MIEQIVLFSYLILDKDRVARPYVFKLHRRRSSVQTTLHYSLVHLL